jgi:CRP/FNR family transcriptional regulator, cyclic AMP receptor protein
VGPADRQAALAKVDMLRGLTAAELTAIAAKCTWREYDKEQQIIEQEGGSHDVYFVVTGAVRITIYAVSGREIAFRDLAAGTSFGELSAVDGRTRSTSVVALQKTWLASVSRNQFRDLLRTYPVFVDNVLKGLVALVRNLTERVVDYSTLSVRYRIQAELVRMAQAKGTKENRTVIAPAPKHADIASRVSTNREEVAREFGRLTRAGLIERRRGELVILNVTGLADSLEKVREG